MLTSIFLIAAPLLLLFSSFFWNSYGAQNKLVKATLFLTACLGIVVIVGHFGLLALV